MSALQTTDHPPTIMLVAGEPSGDALGGQLIEALNILTAGKARIVGVGGPLMRAAGLQSLFSLDDTSVMGLREVAPRIPRILARVRQAADFAVKTRPDISVMIDSPDFTHRVAKRIRRLAPDLRVVSYVAPQVWATRPRRAQKMAAYFDHVLCLLPFEVPFFSNAGLKATFVGHPVVERAPAAGLGPEFRTRHGLSAGQRVLVLLPGSRLNEIRFLWPVFRSAIEKTEAAVGPLTVVVPTVKNVAARVRKLVAEWNRPVIVVEDQKEKFAAFEAADVALAASGTVSTELALFATPMVIGYRLGALTAMIARPFVRVKFITLVNLILQRKAIPEFVQEDCTPDNLSAELTQLLTNSSARVAQVTASTEAIKALGLGDEKPSMRAARAILTLLREPKQDRKTKKAAPASAALKSN
ncbi:MAG: lipid-A-disaccharide synthase [Alphaproteobacteria bacterium]|nr:lipid-A-disaccharide synthase [Alphaproteobacteria bacterium]